MWVSQYITIGVNGEIINNDNTLKEGNFAVLGILPADQPNYKIFNGKKWKWDDFINMKSPWCLLYVIATNANGNKEPHILSCHRRDQTGHYYLIESAAHEVVFRFPDLDHLAKNLFKGKGRLNIISKLREYGPFENIPHGMRMMKLHT